VSDKLFPRRALERCHPNVQSAACNGRRAAIRSGELYWDFERGGWVSTMNPLRSQTWEQVYRSGANNNGLAYLIELCPYCGSEMPELFKPRKIVLPESE
jgi:hypothetical protein